MLKSLIERCQTISFLHTWFRKRVVNTPDLRWFALVWWATLNYFIWQSVCLYLCLSVQPPGTCSSCILCSFLLCDAAWLAEQSPLVHGVGQLSGGTVMIQLKKDIAVIVGMCSPGKEQLTWEDRESEAPKV